MYILCVLIKGEVKLPEAKKQHRYAFFIAAHNEDQLLATLLCPFFLRIILESLWTSFVVAGRFCTDKTLKRLEKLEQLLGSVMTLLVKVRAGLWITSFDCILNEYGDKYEAFITMDADNPFLQATFKDWWIRFLMQDILYAPETQRILIQLQACIRYLVWRVRQFLE